nr:conjugal transfer protein [Galbibacter orientalis]
MGLLILSFLYLPTAGNSQGMPVYDNTNFISLAKQLIESGKQTSQLMQTVNFLKKQKENLEKVNSVIRQLHALKALTNNNQRLFEMVQSDLSDVLSSPYIKPDEVGRIADSFDAIMINAVASLDYVEQILSSDLLKMTDADRVQLLQEKEQESKEMVAEIENKMRRYQEIISFRKLQSTVNSRIANY